MQRDTSLHAIDALHERGNGLDIGIGRLGAKALEEVQQFGGLMPAMVSMSFESWTVHVPWAVLPFNVLV